MANKDSLIKEIDSISDKIKFYYSLFLALISGIVGVAFAFVEKKVDNYAIIFIGFGLLVFVLLLLKIKILEDNRVELIEKLRKE